MGINVLFIYPNTYGMNMLPPAIALFSALLKQNSHKVEVFDATYYQTDYGIDSDGTKMEFLNVAPYDMDGRGINLRNTDWRVDLKTQIDTFQPDLIAISSTEDMWELGMHILEEVRDYKTQNNIPVIAGGVFPTFAPNLALQYPLVDMVCIGEGENALIDLCQHIEAGDSWDNVTNLWVKKMDGSILKNSVTTPVNINELPVIDIKLFEDARLYRPMAGRVYRMLPIETIRGCPYTCRFCNSPSKMSFYKSETGGGFFRKKSIDLVYKELRSFKDELNLEYAYFWADTFLSWNKADFYKFCDMYEKYKLPFWIQTRPETIKKEYFERLKEIGLLRVSFGIEHGNEEFRTKILKRSWKNEAIIEALKIPHRYGVQFTCNNIVRRCLTIRHFFCLIYMKNKITHPRC